MSRRAGYEVVEAGGGEAIRAVRRRDIDAILCDVFMPRRGGPDVHRHLRREGSGIPAEVAVSGGGDFHGKVDILPPVTFLGAVAVLHKPFTQRELRAAITKALQTREPE